MIFKQSAIAFSFAVIALFPWNDGRHIGCHHHHHLALAQEQEYGLKKMRGDDAIIVEADSDRFLKSSKVGKAGKVKGAKKNKSKKEVDFPNSSDEEMHEQQCTIDFFKGSYRYISPCGTGMLVAIVCGEEDDDTCLYSERVIAQDACPESGVLNDEEEEDPCSVGGLFKRSKNVKYNAETDSCELAYFDLSEDICDLYPVEGGGLGMKAVINFSVRQKMLLRFTSDYGETYYNEEVPRIAVFSSDVDQYDAARALSSDIIHAAKQRRQNDVCKECEENQNVFLLEDNGKESIDLNELIPVGDGVQPVGATGLIGSKPMGSFLAVEPFQGYVYFEVHPSTLAANKVNIELFAGVTNGKPCSSGVLLESTTDNPIMTFTRDFTASYPEQYADLDGPSYPTTSNGAIGGAYYNIKNFRLPTGDKQIYFPGKGDKLGQYKDGQVEICIRLSTKDDYNGDSIEEYYDVVDFQVYFGLDLTAKKILELV